RSDPPTNPELLDYLAARFMSEGWSLKKLHKWILLSAAYQQSSDPGPKIVKQNAAIDPNNELLWKMNRRRLDFEAMRDTFLTVSGKIDLRAGGLPVELTSTPFSTRRSVYGYIDRQNLPGVFRTFDFANPDTTSPQRFYTTVPQQALFLMNNPFMMEQARNVMNRPDVAATSTEDERIRLLYRIAFQRGPDSDELKTAKQFLEAQAVAPAVQPEPPIWQYGYGRFDPQTGKVAAFTALGHFTGKTWQAGRKLPDAVHGYVSLTAEGGHPGSSSDRSAIRRWTAPQDGVVTIEGTLSHPSNKGDGLQGRVVSAYQGELKSGVAYNGKTELKLADVTVKKGETIDFVAECRADSNTDSFAWAPKIRYQSTGGGASREFDARKDFGQKIEKPKPLDVWEKYAQVLLLSNEFVFVD
ncbi:MAG: DUF1553 domain-containing protein, partial [Verrucomicrobiota bacterium]